MPASVQYQQIPLNVPTSVLQNETFGLPNRACLVFSTVALEVGFSQAGPFVAQPTTATTGWTNVATWARCPSAAAIVSCKIG